VSFLQWDLMSWLCKLALWDFFSDVCKFFCHVPQMVSTLWVANEPSFRRDGNVPWNLRNDACATKEFGGKCGAYEVLLLQIMPGSHGLHWESEETRQQHIRHRIVTYEDIYKQVTSTIMCSLPLTFNLLNFVYNPPLYSIFSY
jgi:hypothetical protein